jgi:phospholipid/cholesterol/gamma-HCH transport system substrate-binding protein
LLGELPQASAQAALPQRRRWVMVLIVLVGLLALAGFLLGKISTGPSLRLNACFQDVNGLRKGSRVRLAGVDIGVVREVRAQPSNKACPGAVEMKVSTPYQLRIPQDSVASTAAAGVLGETYLEIDVSGASGPPIQSGGRLPSKEGVKFTAIVDQALKKLQQQITDAEKNCVAQPGDSHSRAKPSPKSSPSSVPK